MDKFFKHENGLLIFLWKSFRNSNRAVLSRPQKVALTSSVRGQTTHTSSAELCLSYPLYPDLNFCSPVRPLIWWRRWWWPICHPLSPCGDLHPPRHDKVHWCHSRQLGNTPEGYKEETHINIVYLFGLFFMIKILKKYIAKSRSTLLFKITFINPKFNPTFLCWWVRFSDKVVFYHHESVRLISEMHWLRLAQDLYQLVGKK